MSGAVFATRVIRPLTDTQREVKDAEPNVQPEEEDGVGHFTEQEQIAYVLLQCDWEENKRRRRRREGEQWMQKENLHTRSEGGRITLQL